MRREVPEISIQDLSRRVVVPDIGDADGGGARFVVAFPAATEAAGWPA